MVHSHSGCRKLSGSNRSGFRRRGAGAGRRSARSRSASARSQRSSAAGRRSGGRRQRRLRRTDRVGPGRQARVSRSASRVQCQARQCPSRRTDARGVRLQVARDAAPDAHLHAARLLDQQQVPGALSAAWNRRDRHRVDGSVPRERHHRQSAGRWQGSVDGHGLPRRQFIKDGG
jgi:hypothetical protein